MKDTKISKITKVLLFFQAAALLAGNYVGWTTILKEVDTYCTKHGSGLWSLTDFSGSITGNPIISPCFWGSIVFLVTFTWTVILLLENNQDKLRSGINKIWWVLLGGTIFALVNNLPIIYKFYTRPAGSIVSCSADKVTNPYLTSCFLGFSAFLTAFVICCVIKHLINKTRQKTQ